MRSTLQIIIAVKECQPVTEQELKYALAALSAIDHFRSQTIDGLIEAAESGNDFQLKFRIASAKQQRESLFTGIKTDVVKWLGPGNIPGSPEQQERLAWAKRVFEKATGEKL